MLCKLVVSLQMQNRKTTDKVKISIVPNLPIYSTVVIAGQRALITNLQNPVGLLDKEISESRAVLGFTYGS